MRRSAHGSREALEKLSLVRSDHRLSIVLFHVEPAIAGSPHAKLIDASRYGPIPGTFHVERDLRSSGSATLGECATPSSAPLSAEPSYLAAPIDLGGEGPIATALRCA